MLITSKPIARRDFSMPPDAGELFLLREMHHRFANSFTTLIATMRREFRSSATLNVQESLDRCVDRIFAFAELHRFLIVGGQHGWIPVQSYIEGLCHALSGAHLQPLGVRCEVSAGTAFLPADQCELLGLAVAELVTNSAKHAFNGRDDGLVRIEFISAPDAWTCIVSDNGHGLSTNSTGAGSKILGTLMRALGAELVVKSGALGTSSAVHWEEKIPTALQDQ